jgi:hypothetical protein
MYSCSGCFSTGNLAGESVHGLNLGSGTMWIDYAFIHAHQLLSLLAALGSSCTCRSTPQVQNPRTQPERALASRRLAQGARNVHTASSSRQRSYSTQHAGQQQLRPTFYIKTSCQ